MGMLVRVTYWDCNVIATISGEYKGTEGRMVHVGSHRIREDAILPNGFERIGHTPETLQRDAGECGVQSDGDCSDDALPSQHGKDMAKTETGSPTAES